MALSIRPRSTLAKRAVLVGSDSSPSRRAHSTASARSVGLSLEAMAQSSRSMGRAPFWSICFTTLATTTSSSASTTTSYSAGARSSR
eukprot:143304-Rhodomonas_salina.1